MREVLPGLIGCALAAISYCVVERREIQTGDISYAGACTGILSQIRTKLLDWAVWPARDGCYCQAELSFNDSNTL